ncbi:MAG TPA: tRNA (guanine(46)-N(7))-methyltransferase TrmB [Chlamydiales bacterium]|nr:tRNA (guanine(46)-N(7))-methyltransferase TrmB [Chlamydiales bacterium]
MLLMKKPSDLKIPFIWEERRPIMLDHFLYVPEHYDRHPAWSAIPWEDPSIFGSSRPVFLEYCSGNGQWICERAKKHPEMNWVALELRFDRARKIWLRMYRDHLPNLFIMCGEARILTRYYIPKKSLSKVFVNFPDPWPKLRHAKHRLIQISFLKEMGKAMLPQAEAHFVTDDAVYAAQMLRELRNSPEWIPKLADPHYVLNPPDYGDSFFSDLWKKKGHNIYFIPFINNKFTLR